MYRLIILGALCISIASISAAQNGYERVYGGSMPDWFHGVLPTADGGCIATGATRSFGFGDITNTDGYTVKINADGDTAWSKTFGTINSEEAQSVIENDFGYLVSGYN